MALRWASKSPDEVVDRQLSWTALLNGDEINTHALTVMDGTIALDSVVVDGDDVLVRLSGGVSGEPVILQSRITTLDGRTLDQLITLDVVDLTTGTVPDAPSTATKRQILDMMFEEAGLASYNFSRTPEQDFSALRKLDALMGEWQVQGLSLNYNFPATFAAGDPDDVAGIPDWAVNTVAIAAAYRVFPGMGKTASPETRKAYAEGMAAIRVACSTTPERKLSRGTPLGAGNKPYSTWRTYARGT
jgi:hypothetical protein